MEKLFGKLKKNMQKNVKMLKNVKKNVKKMTKMIEEYPDYEISNYGEVIYTHTGRVLKPRKNRGG
jgi:hypothetical protein